MTQRALVGQGDIERALKACKRAGYEKARVHINVRAQTIDIMLGEDQPKGPPAYNPWDEEFRDDPPPPPQRKRHVLPNAATPAEIEASMLRARSRTRSKRRTQ